MSLRETVVNIIHQLIKNSDIYLVDVLVSESKIRRKITVFLDTDEGIKIDDCSKISHQLGLELEEIIDNAFVLEVSSPGADSPLKMERQFIKNIGRTLKVITVEEEEIKGVLVNFLNNEIEIQPEKKKKIVFDSIKIKLEKIKEAKVIISFK